MKTRAVHFNGATSLNNFNMHDLIDWFDAA